MDARSKNRFLGLESEPRPGIKSGSIEGSKSLPLSELINTKDNTFLDKETHYSLIAQKFSIHILPDPTFGRPFTTEILCLG